MDFTAVKPCDAAVFFFAVQSRPVRTTTAMRLTRFIQRARGRLSAFVFQCGGDASRGGHGVLHQREPAAERDALLPQPWVVRYHGYVRQHRVLHGPHVPAHLHQVSRASRLTCNASALVCSLA